MLQNTRRLLLIELLAVSAPAWAQSKPTPTSKPLIWGVVPQQSAVELAKVWVPLIAWVSQHSRVPLRFATAPDIPTFEKRLLSGEYDLAYMNPYHYTAFNKKPGYQAFAKEKGRSLKGIVVVRKDAPYKTLEDLRDKEIAFPAPAAFAATVLVRAELKKRGISYTPKFVNSHESVYLNVSKRFMAAGGGIPRTFQTMETEIRQELRILHSTAEYSPHAFAAHPRVASEQVQAVLKSMQSLDKDTSGHGLLEPLGFKGFEAAQDAQWNDVRQLGINTLAELLRG
jgi:phosphonate transport system substrate-binding protein